jgi:microcystin-dependent protein
MGSPVKPDDFKALISDPNSTMCENFVKTLLRLPVVLWQFINWLLDSDGNFTTAAQSAISEFTIKPGDLIFSASALDEDGRLLCNGQSVLRASYPVLFGKIGTSYGAVDGTHFTLPDFKDRFPVGVSGTKALGNTGGVDTVTLVEANLPPHTHEILMRDDDPGTGAFYPRWEEADPNTSDKSAVTGPAAGTSLAFSIQNPFLACYIYIKY